MASRARKIALRTVSAAGAPFRALGRRLGISSRYDGGWGQDGELRHGGIANPFASAFLFGWTPVLREPVDEIVEAWPRVTAQVINAIQNSGFLAGALNKGASAMIGPDGLQLNYKPDKGLWGGDQDAANKFARDAERRFEAWCKDPWACDLGARQTIGMMERGGVKQYYATGEMVALMSYKKRPGNTHGLKINFVPSIRLAQWNYNATNCVQGVILGQDGEPVGYCFWQRNYQTGWGKIDMVEVAARDSAGDPVVIHLFEVEPGAVRGITPLHPVLKVLRQYDQLADATLTAALIQTIFAATVESDNPTRDVLASMQNEAEQEANEGKAGAGDFERLMGNRLDWYKRTKIDLGQLGKILHMFPGEKLTFNRSEHPNGNYKEFVRWLMLEVSVCIGVTYNALTNDYSGETYTTSRVSTNDHWPLMLSRRAMIPARFKQTVFEAWLTEDIEMGIGPIAFPGGIENFRANRADACFCEWRGPPKPTADDLKTAKANQILRAERWASREQLAAEYGNDWQLVNEQAEREQDDDEDRELPPPPALNGMPGGPEAGLDAGQAPDHEPGDDPAPGAS